MKKLLILFLIVLVIGCNDREDVTPVGSPEDVPTQIYGTMPKKRTGGVQTLDVTCGYGTFVHNLYGTYANPTPYMTPMTMRFYALPNATDQISTYVTYAAFYNNSPNLIRLFKDGVSQGTVSAYTTKKIYFNGTCSCPSCPELVDIYYNWAVYKHSGPNAGTQVVVSNVVLSTGHVNGNPGGSVCTIYFE